MRCLAAGASGAAVASRPHRGGPVSAVRAVGGTCSAATAERSRARIAAFASGTTSDAGPGGDVVSAVAPASTGATGARVAATATGTADARRIKEEQDCPGSRVTTGTAGGTAATVATAPAGPGTTES